MLPMLQIGPLNLQTGGLILVFAAWLGLTLIEKIQNDGKISSKLVSDSVIWGLVSGLVFSRLGYLLAFPNILFQNPLSLFSLNIYQFDLVSGLAGFSLAIAVFSSRKHVSFQKLLDDLIPFLICVIAGYFLSTLASGEVYGSPAILPWSISLWGISRHPVQIYDLFILTLSFFMVLLVFTRMNLKVQPASKFLLLITILALDQTITIPFRADPGISYLANIRLQQVIAWVILFVSLMIIRNINNPVQLVEE
jgi:phosphatidylglycerol---prolipoprotein diacylglyceryl transferase